MSRNELLNHRVKGEVSRRVLTRNSILWLPRTQNFIKFYYYRIAFPMNGWSSRRENVEVRDKCSNGINSRHVRQEQSRIKSKKSIICIFAISYFNSSARFVILTIPH